MEENKPPVYGTTALYMRKVRGCSHDMPPQKIYISGITLNFDNLEALCQECHNKEHFQKYNTAIFDANGNMTGVKESAELEEYKKAIEELERMKKGRVESP